MKKFKILALLIVAGILLVGCLKNEEKEKTDAEKFIEEYTSINGQKRDDGKTIRTISLSKDNVFVYSSAEEIVEKIENNESFVVYFGFANCPWCRSVIEQLDQVSRDIGFEKIYYVDVTGIRDVKEIDEENQIVTRTEGTKSYMRLIEQLEEVLEDYTLTKDEEKISAGEKRIYAPNVIAISNGEAIKLETGISDELTDPYMKLTDSIKQYAYNTFKCLLECIDEESAVCESKMC